MNNEIEPQVEGVVGDVDTDGHLAFALFIGGIIVLVLVIYALAQAA